MLLRILASILLLLSVLFAPFWVSVILAIAGMMYFRFFIEAVFLLLITDLLYAVPMQKFFEIVPVAFLGSLFCFIILELLKRKLRLQRN